jgi:hypothetical protein
MATNGSAGRPRRRPRLPAWKPSGSSGSSSVVGSGGDVLKIPSGVTNYWQAVFVFVTQIPGVGRKKVVLADRRGAVGDFTKIV